MSEADAADRLILDESRSARSATPPGALVVVGDESGALTHAVLAEGADGVRVHQDTVTAERALREDIADAAQMRSLALGPDLVVGAATVLLRLPRSLEALRDIAGLIAAHTRPDVTVFAGGRIKHMTIAMNEVLGAHFATVDVTHARQNSRVLVARGPHDGRDPIPRSATQMLPGLPKPVVVCALGGAFAGTSVDIGTRFLLENLPARIPAEGDIVDLACGTGVVATWLALQHPALSVLATDRSAAAISSAQATAAANGIADRVHVARDDGLASRPDGSATFIVLNPPFHDGAAVDERLALSLFTEAARALRPGGELWTVWNSPLAYRAALSRIVGPTRQVARNAKFTVTVSVRG